MSLFECADMYAALAEVLADPPEWMALPGREWPLFELARALIPNSTGLTGLALIQAEELPLRQARYAALFSAAAGQPHYWLSESAFLTGCILGPHTFGVAKCYAEAGLQVNGSELPDSAWMELAFLGQLSAGSDGVAAEKLFLAQHAGRWLPELGSRLTRSGDPVYAAIGQLMSDWLCRFKAPSATARTFTGQLPMMQAETACTLCGFCAQRCPSAALFIQENAIQTALVFVAEQCTGCGKCIRVCDAACIRMQPADVRSPVPLLMVVSERVACYNCGQPMVSRAELDFVIRQIGHPTWLDYCSNCRVPAQMRTEGNG